MEKFLDDLDDFINHMFPPVEDKPGYIWINKRNHEMAKADLVNERMARVYEQYCILRADMIIIDEFLKEEENDGN